MKCVSASGPRSRLRELRPWALLLACGILLLAAAGCGWRDSVTELAKNERWRHMPLPAKPAKPLADVLHLLIWRDYLEPEILEHFSQTYGVRIDVTYFENNSELKQRFAAEPNKYDLIMPSDYVVERLIKQNLLAPLNKANIPNMGSISPVFFRSPYDRELVYSVPLFFSALGITFNSEHVRHTPRNFSLRGESSEENLRLHGYRALVDEPRVSLSAALLDDKVDPNGTNHDALVKVTDRLIEETNELGIRFLASELPRELIKNQISIAVNWSGAAAVAVARNPAIRFVLPEGPKFVQVDNFVIPRTAPHKATAEFFLNFLLLPQISGALTNYSFYATTNVQARSYINREILLGPAYIEPPVTSRVFFADLGPFEDEFETQWKRLQQNRTPVSAKVPLSRSRGEQARQQDVAR